MAKFSLGGRPCQSRLSHYVMAHGSVFFSFLSHHHFGLHGFQGIYLLPPLEQPVSHRYSIQEEPKNSPTPSLECCN